MPAWRLPAAAAALAGYAALSQQLLAHAPEAPWTVALLFGPLLAAMVGAALKRRHAPTLLLAAAAAAALAVFTLRGGIAGFERLYVLEHAAFHAALAWTFAFTLRPGATPLITALAERIHAAPAPAVRAYTRRLTAVWAAYFVAMIALSLALYALAPWPAWTFFASVLTPLAAAALFVGEHLLRYRRHPEFERATLAQALRAYRAPVR